MPTPGIIEDDSFSDAERAADRRARRIMLGVAGTLALFAAVGVSLAVEFVSGERERALQQWQVRLGVVADSRTGDVSLWLNQPFATLRSLAQNASLQLYVGGLAQAAGAKDSEAVEGGYLRNLLTATAQRDGFVASRPKEQINANVESSGTSGLAITDPGGRILVATSGMPALPPQFQQAMAEAKQGKPGLVDINISAAGLPVIGFVQPIYSIQGDPGVTPSIGFVAGMKEVDRDLFSRLDQPGDTSESAETYLIRRDGEEITFLSPLADGSEPLRRQLAYATPGLADAIALDHPGGFGQARDYRGHDVLFVSRKIGTTPWVLIRKIDRTEALGEAERRLGIILAVLIVAVAGAIALSLALWKQGTSVRLEKAMSRNRAILETMRRTSEFLQLVSDAQPTAIATVDLAGHYSFANKMTAVEAGSEPAAILGKTMPDVLGPYRAQLYGEMNKMALKQGQAVSQIHRFDEQPPRTVRSTHIPLTEENRETGVLMILEDVTELFRERDRAEKTLEGLVKALVALLDSRVPYSSNHSARVALVSKGIAEEMGATPLEVRTAEVTGNLINLGKLLVPQDLLTKTSALSEEEREIVRRSLLDTAELLKNVEFDIPVAQALAETQERFDGAGYPKGLKAEEIILPARVVTLANGFVSLTSARAFREAMTNERACEVLLEEADSQYDRRAVAALMNFLFNRGGVEQLSGRNPTEDAALV